MPGIGRLWPPATRKQRDRDRSSFSLTGAPEPLERGKPMGARELDQDQWTTSLKEAPQLPSTADRSIWRPSSYKELAGSWSLREDVVHREEDRVIQGLRKLWSQRERGLQFNSAAAFQPCSQLQAVTFLESRGLQGAHELESQHFLATGAS